MCAATSGSGTACAIPMEKCPQGEDYDNSGQTGQRGEILKYGSLVEI